MPRTYINKSGRRRGVIYMLIRAMARRRKKFKTYDFVPPLTPYQAHNSLRNLTASGELVRVKKELVKRDGLWDIQGVYAATAQLRPSELTNRHI